MQLIANVIHGTHVVPAQINYPQVLAHEIPIAVIIFIIHRQ